jgi:hypothetical protein
MQWLAVWFVFLFSAVGVRAASLSKEVMQHNAVAELMEEPVIHIATGGSAEMSFEDTCRLLNREDLLTALQQGYAAVSLNNEPPEFVITQTGPTFYHYVNRHDQETRIEEVSRHLVERDRIVVAYYTEGKRWFGTFRSICQIVIVPQGSERVDYSVSVYAYPESRTIRFVSKMAPVKRFFRSKTDEMTSLGMDICEWMVSEEARNEAKLAEFTTEERAES